MIDLNRLFHRRDENDTNIWHYSEKMILMLDIRIHLNHKLQSDQINMINFFLFHFYKSISQSFFNYICYIDETIVSSWCQYRTN